jgi:preprotein translocase subunit SecG
MISKIIGDDQLLNVSTRVMCFNLNNMEALNIITVIAIILFARLAIRLAINYSKHKKKSKNDE